MICELVTKMVDRGWFAAVYTNRKLLIDQLSGVLEANHIAHGVRAAGYDSDRDCVVQISSLPTERSRTLKKGIWKPHGGEHGKVLAVVDEAHLNATPTAKELLDYHVSHGGVALGVTATPVDLGWLYTLLIEAAKVSDCLSCGALLPAIHYGPDEPDMKSLKWIEGKDFSENQIRKAMPKNHLWGRVWPWFEKLNPDRRPTILFAPGVAESVWFAEQFRAKGVKAAHIDGQEVWIDGQVYRSDREIRRGVLEASKAGEIIVLCNRFVLREGIDAPWLSHCIFATVFGSLQSYLQSGGRLLRAYPGMEHITIQDHGGNWWRHGDLSADRDWNLSYTAGQMYGMRAQDLREKPEKQPFLCPQCSMVLTGPICRKSSGGCGYEVKTRQRSRPVYTQDGVLRQMHGDVFRQRRIGPAHLAAGWVRMVKAMRNKKSNRNYNQAAAFWAGEHGWEWPDPKWPMTPKETADWYTPLSELHPEKFR